MDTDIRDEIERSFDEGPPIDDLDLLLIRGHAAVRRRRLAEGGSVLLVAAAITVAALVTGGSSGTTSPAPVDTPTASTLPTPVVPDPTELDVVPSTAPTAVLEPGPVEIVEDPTLPRAEPIRLVPPNAVHHRPGVQVEQVLHEPDSPLAVQYTLDGQTWWFIDSQEPGDSGGIQIEPPESQQ